MTQSNEFPGNVFVARNYPAPQAPTVTYDPPQTVVTDEMIDSAKAAEILGITTNNLRQMVHKKRLVVASREGRRSMFRRSDVEALAARRGK